jgi:hypothetical protein
MAYTAGDTILDDEYNTFATGNAAGTGDNGTANLNTLWGTGTLDYGYGETGSTIAAVSAGSTITAAQWNTLLGRIETIGAHQGTTVTDYSTLSAGNTIAALADVSGDISDCFSNRLNAAASGSTVTTSGAATYGSSWQSSISGVHRITFASANALRYFFNAGGLITFTFSRSGGTTNDKNTEWSDLATKMGTITFSGSASHTVNSVAYTGTTQTGGGAGGAGSAKSTIDAFALTTSYQQLIIKYADTAPYTANYIKLEAQTDAAAGSATYINFKVTAVDDAADTANPAYPLAGTNPGSLDLVDGTWTSTMNYILPASTQLTSAAWGSPTMSVATAYSGS